MILKISNENKEIKLLLYSKNKHINNILDIIKSLLLIIYSVFGLNFIRKLYKFLFPESAYFNIGADTIQLIRIRNCYYKSFAILIGILLIIYSMSYNSVIFNDKIILGIISFIIITPRTIALIFISPNSFPVNTAGRYFYSLIGNITTILGIILSALILLI